jgi:hypothetical protein
MERQARLGGSEQRRDWAIPHRAQHQHLSTGIHTRLTARCRAPTNANDYVCEELANQVRTKDLRMWSARGTAGGIDRLFFVRAIAEQFSVVEVVVGSVLLLERPR